jgi:glutamyl-tRNA(Gln) amidotransferase subunit E
MADRSRFWGRVGGIFHTDEMPAYGITMEEVDALRKAVEADETDAVVFVSDRPENAADALKAVVERAREAIKGVPQETRGPNPDGTTRYMRPRPGAARMYPETDIPPMQLAEDYVRSVSSRLPEFPEQKVERLIKERKLNQKLAKQMVDSEYSELFETIINESSVSPTTVAAFLTETMKALRRDGVDVYVVSENQLRELFKAVAKGELMREALQDVYVWLSKHNRDSVKDAINKLGLTKISEKELETFVGKVIAENRSLIEEKGEDSFGVLMSITMKSLRGKADVAQVSRVLKEKLKQTTK